MCINNNLASWCWRCELEIHKSIHNIKYGTSNIIYTEWLDWVLSIASLYTCFLFFFCCFVCTYIPFNVKTYIINSYHLYVSFSLVAFSSSSSSFYFFLLNGFMTRLCLFIVVVIAHVYLRMIFFSSVYLFVCLHIVFA